MLACSWVKGRSWPPRELCGLCRLLVSTFCDVQSEGTVEIVCKGHRRCPARTGHICLQAQPSQTPSHDGPEGVSGAAANRTCTSLSARTRTSAGFRSDAAVLSRTHESSLGSRDLGACCLCCDVWRQVADKPGASRVPLPHGPTMEFSVREGFTPGVRGESPRLLGVRGQDDAGGAGADSMQRRELQ